MLRFEDMEASGFRIENVETAGWEAAFRGMRNPLNSWNKSDSDFPVTINNFTFDKGMTVKIGPKDHKLAMNLRNAGTDHRKFLRMIVCYCDITAPLYWHKEMDTYRAGVEKNSCSTMHTIHKEPFKVSDFSCDHMQQGALDLLRLTVDKLNKLRDVYLYGGTFRSDIDSVGYFKPHDRDIWYSMIQLLPSSYNQKRTYMMSYEALANMYRARKNHKLDCWRAFCKWIEMLPYSELITGGKADEQTE